MENKNHSIIEKGILKSYEQKFDSILGDQDNWMVKSSYIPYGSDPPR